LLSPSAPILPPAIAPDARRLALAGDLLVAVGSTGVSFIDIYDPKVPVLMSCCPMDLAHSDAVGGSYVYVAEGYLGLAMIDVSHPARPSVVTTCVDVVAVGVAVKDAYAIVAGPAGLRVVQMLIPGWLQGKTP
jgi:hypothetical protein